MQPKRENLNKKALLATGLLWPVLVAASCCVLTIGGAELAVMDVPLVNSKVGFQALPLGCESRAPWSK